MKHSNNLLLYFILNIVVISHCAFEHESSNLNFGVSSIPTSLDPAYTQEFVATKILPNIFETLVQYEDSTLTTQPTLAESVAINADATVWTFYLRRNVRFHDGTLFTAEAVKISFDRQIKPQSEFYSSNDWTPKKTSIDMIDRIEILDPYIVRFYLRYPYVPFHHNLATCFGSAIVSPAALRKYGTEFGRHPVGTGPFRLEAWNEEKNITLSANEQYWGETPKIEKVSFIAVPRVIDRAERIINGSLHFAEDVGPTLIDRLYLNPDIQLVFAKAFGVTVLGFHCQKQPFTDGRVRRAIALAFNKEKFVYTMLRGRGQVADGPLPRSMRGRQASLGSTRFDPEAAKKLLAEAGYPNGFPVDLWCFNVSERAGILPLAIKKDLGRIGIEVKIKYIDDWKMYNTGVTKGDAPLFVDGWRGDTADPDSYLYPTFHSRGGDEQGNLFHYSNEELDQLLEKARRTKDSETRMELYVEAQNTILSDQPCLFISYYNEVLAVRNCVQGFTISPLGMVRLNHVEWNCH